MKTRGEKKKMEKRKTVGEEEKGWIAKKKDKCKKTLNRPGKKEKKRLQEEPLGRRQDHRRRKSKKR